MATPREELLDFFEDIGLTNRNSPPKHEFKDMPRTTFSDSLLHDLTFNQYTLTYLNLSNQDLQEDRMQYLTTALEKNTTIKTLILSGCKVLASVFALSIFLYSNKTITTLYLNDITLRSYGLGELGQALKANQTLTTLYLGSCKITDSGAAKLGQYLEHNTHLKTLDLSKNHIEDLGLQALSSFLAKNCGLTKLSLKGHNFGEEGAIALVDCLKENDTLESVDLDHCFLKDCKAIDTIIQGLSQKKNRTVLKELKLSENNMGEVGAIALTEALKNNYGLKSLEIAKNNLAYESLDDEGISAIVDSIIRHPSITHIDLRNNKISSGANAIVKMLKENTRIISVKVDEEDSSAMNKAIPKIQELLEKNKEMLYMTGKRLVDYFSLPVGLQSQMDRNMLKYYQACDHELLVEFIGNEDYMKVKKGVDRYLAANYLKLMGCVGNGKSTMEKLSAQTHFNIFSYLDLSKCLWDNEIYGRDTPAKNSQNTTNKSEGSWCNMW